MYGDMMMSLEYIDEFNLTKPLAVNGDIKYYGHGEEYENGRVRSAVASDYTKPTLRAKIVAKKAVACGHVIIHENFLVDQARVPRSVPSSLWTQARLGVDNYRFRDCCNFFSHAFLNSDLGSDLKQFSDVQKLYSEQVAVLKVLIEKLKIGLGDESAGKTEKSELSYTNRPEYAVDSQEAEAELEESLRIIEPIQSQKHLVPSSPVSQDGWGLEEAVIEDQARLSENSIVEWLLETIDWESGVSIQRRYSCSHPSVEGC
jgi:hypothetical protein